MLLPLGVAAPAFRSASACGRELSPVCEAPHPLPLAECAGQAPLTLPFGLLRKPGEMWFPQDSAAASGTVRWRYRPCGEEVTADSGFSLVCIVSRPFPNIVTLGKSHHYLAFVGDDYYFEK